MALFPKTLKLYHFFEKKEVSLSIKVSDEFVITYWMNEDKFQRMIKECYDSKGFSGGRFFVLVKKDYVRFSKSIDGVASHFRIDNEKWAALVKDYNQKLKSLTGDYFACEID